MKQQLRARLEAYQRQTHDPRITGDMTIFAETLKFVQSRKADGYKPTKPPSPSLPAPEPANDTTLH